MSLEQPVDESAPVPDLLEQAQAALKDGSAEAAEERPPAIMAEKAFLCFLRPEDGRWCAVPLGTDIVVVNETFTIYDALAAGSHLAADSTAVVTGNFQAQRQAEGMARMEEMMNRQRLMGGMPGGMPPQGPGGMRL